MIKPSWVHLFLNLLFCKVSFNQRAHHLLWGASGADVWKDYVPMGLLCIANPAWIKTEMVHDLVIITIDLMLMHLYTKMNSVMFVDGT